MKICDYIKLGTTGIKAHPWRNVTLVLAVAALFGLVMTVRVMAAGILPKITELSRAPTQNRTYIAVWYDNIVSADGKDVARVSSWDEVMNGLLKLETDGKFLGRMCYYFRNGIGGINVVEPDVVSDFMTRDLGELSGFVPIVTWGNNETPVDERLAVAGVFPATNFNGVLNSHFITQILSPMIPGTDIYRHEDYMIDTGLEAVSSYLEETGITDEMRRGANSFFKREQVVYRFDSPDKAKAFQDNLKIPKYISVNGRDYVRIDTEVFGNLLGVEAAYKYYNYWLNVLTILLLIIAVLFTVTMFGHLIDLDMPTIALYQSLGATRGQTWRVYLVYLLTLCWFACLASVVISYATAGIMNLLNAGDVALVLKDFYLLKDAPKVSLVGFSEMILVDAAIILLAAPITMILTMKKFSARYIAKRIKRG